MNSHRSRHAASRPTGVPSACSIAMKRPCGSGALAPDRSPGMRYPIAKRRSRRKRRRRTGTRRALPADRFAVRARAELDRDAVRIAGRDRAALRQDGIAEIDVRANRSRRRQPGHRPVAHPMRDGGWRDMSPTYRHRSSIRLAFSRDASHIQRRARRASVTRQVAPFCNARTRPRCRCPTRFPAARAARRARRVASPGAPVARIPAARLPLDAS